MARTLYDCPEIPVGPEGVPYRVVVATHPAGKKKSPISVTRKGVVYELFFTNLQQHAFTACDVVELYLHRGAFEPILSSPMGCPGCPARQSLLAHERRREADGSLRVVYAASIRSCRPCPLRDQCQWNGSETVKPRQVSVLLHPFSAGGEPLLWRDWSRRVHRRACMQLLHHQRVEVHREPDNTHHRDDSSLPLSRASRIHSRLS